MDEPNAKPQPVRITHAVRLRRPIETGIYLGLGIMIALALVAIVVAAVLVLLGGLAL